MNKFKLIALFFITAIFAVSCESVGDAGKVANQFFDNFIEKDYNGMTDLVSDYAFEITPKENWIEYFEEESDLK